MRSCAVLAGAALTFVVAGISAGASFPAGVRAPAGLVPVGDSGEFVPGELLVRFRPTATAPERVEVLRDLNASVTTNLALPQLALVRLAAGASVPAAATALEAKAEVLYAEPNHLYRPAATPNDPRFGELWGLHQASDADIDAPEAWDLTTGSTGVTVAVVDSGIAYDHPDLAPNIWTNPGEIAGDGIDNDGNGFVDDVRGWDFFSGDNNPRDFNGHGTHVAGTIGARGNNAVGITGVNWQVKLMALRASGPGGLPASAIVNSFAYACRNGAQVINGSFGGPSFNNSVLAAIEVCPNSLFVVAAGNEGNNNDTSPRYPCNYDRFNVVCVAATDQTDTLAGFSNYGAASVDLAAPGVAILSTAPAYEALFTDDLETDIGGRWTPSASTPAWTRTSERANSGSFSITDSEGGGYPANQNSNIQKASPLDLTGREGCAVDYWLRLHTESGADILRLEASTDGTTWAQVAGWSGGSSTTPFLNLVDDLSAFDGAATVHFRYRLTSNSVNQFDGAHIDDVVFKCLTSTFGSNDYVELPGTSMATPHVAGVAALVWARNPAATLAGVRNALLSTVDAQSSLQGKTVTGGRLNAFGAVNAAFTPPPPPPPPPSGALDLSFGIGGIVTTGIATNGPRIDYALALARQTDGKLVVAGGSGSDFATFASGGSFSLARYNADGSLDSSFSGDGKVVTDFVADNSKADEAHAVAVQPDGKIVAVGIADTPSSDVGDFALARYNADGSLDTSFSGDGLVTTDMEDVLGLGHDHARAVAIQADGKIVVAGTSTGDFALARYNADGSLDTSFDGNGKVNTPVAPGSSTDEAYAVAIQADGKIVAAGFARVTSFDDDYALARYNTNGSLDTSFDVDGMVTTPIATGGALPKDVVNALAIQPSDGKIVAAGESNADFSLARYHADGSLDTSFDADGKVTTAGPFLRAYAVALRSDGKIVAAGAASAFGVIRYNSDGSFDTTFDTDGRVVTPIAAGGPLEVARGVAIQPDDKIVAAGYADMGAPDNLEFALVRYKPPPTPTAVTIASFAARRAGLTAVEVGWRTATEVDLLGFNLWRYAHGRGVKLNRMLIAAKAAGRVGGAAYRLVDRSARPGASYTYKLQIMSKDGRRVWRGSTTVRVRP